LVASAQPGRIVQLKGDQIGMSRVKVAFAGLVAVLAISAMASSSAMAAGEGWLINGTLLVGSAPLATTAFVDQIGKLKFSTTEIVCKATTLSGVSPQIESPNMGTATSLVFKECSVTSGGECKLESGTTIGTLPILTEVTLDGPLGVRGVFKPKTVTTFATIKLEGTGCAETGKLPIKGTAAWLAPTGQMEQTLQLLSVNVTEASKELEVGSKAASLTGSILIALASLLPWSFM
jgi:hypothetical protein